MVPLFDSCDGGGDDGFTVAAEAIEAIDSAGDVRPVVVAPGASDRAVDGRVIGGRIDVLVLAATLGRALEVVMTLLWFSCGGNVLTLG